MRATLWLIITVGLAVFAFVVGRLNVDRQSKADRNEDLRRERLVTYAALCEKIVEHRRAQLHRWFVEQELEPKEELEQHRPEVAEEVRRARAAKWGQLYKVVMICGDGELERNARHAIDLTKHMKRSSTAEELLERSDDVHSAVNDFAQHAGVSVRAAKQRRLAPPPS